MDNAKELTLQGIQEGYKNAVARSYETMLINEAAHLSDGDVLAKFMLGVDKMMALADETMVRVNAKAHTW